MKKKYLMLPVFLLGVSLSFGQTSPTAQNLPYTQNFSSTAHTSTSYPAGWQGWTIATAPGSTFNTSTPTADRSLVASSSASVNSGNVHNYDGKIGFLNTGSLDLGLVLAINTTNMKRIKVSYDIMTIRNPYDTTTNSRINEVTLQYRIGTSGSFTNLSGIEYQNNTLTQTGSGVTTPQKPESKSITLPSDCDSESVVQLRWASRQVSGSGARPSFAIDNINIDSTSAPVLSVSAVANATEGTSPIAGSFTFTFTPATSASTTFNYALSGTATFGTDYTVTLSGSATPATLSTATGTITVPASSGTITATVTPINDALSEGTETVIVKISSPSGSYAITDSTKTMSLIDDESTRIHTIQGSGSTATSGSYTIEAIVTGVYPTLSPAGFYVQEEDADADADINTSEGIFVVSATAVAVGDKVRVGGTVLEGAASPSFQQAVISATAVAVISSGNPMPALTTISLPLTAVADFEKYEGMLVRFADTLTVTDNYNLGRYGEINLSQGGMIYQPTQIVDLNDAVASGTTASGISNLAAVDAYALSNNVRTILLDDGRGVIPTLPFVNSDNTLRLGSTIDSLTGILGYAFSKYRIQPIVAAPPSFDYAPRPALPSVGSAANIRVASFNVLNYFNGDGMGGGYPTPRGAHSAAEFTRQRDKIINALADINADVVGLIEIENDGTGSNSAIQDLVNGLNAKLGTGTYSIVNDGASIQTYCTDQIRCGIIYKSSVVTTVGSAMLSANTIFNRPPLAQAFTLTATGMKFNFIINHFKSKSCSGSTGADQDQLDGQSCYNSRRKMQAGELDNFIKTTVVPASGTSFVLSMGDYNAYFEEDPLDTLRAAGYTVLGAATGYSYLFNGLVGSLDNAIVTDSLKSKVTGIAKWNINSAEPVFLDYNDAIDDGGGDFVNQWGSTYTTTPYKSSDHDPVIVGLNLAPASSVHEAGKGTIFRIYPNPGTSVIHLENTLGKAAEWQIVNTLGQVIMNGTITIADRYTTANIQYMNPGVYLFRVKTADGMEDIQRFVKQ